MSSLPEPHLYHIFRLLESAWWHSFVNRETCDLTTLEVDQFLAFDGCKTRLPCTVKLERYLKLLHCCICVISVAFRLVLDILEHKGI